MQDHGLSELHFATSSLCMILTAGDKRATVFAKGDVLDVMNEFKQLRPVFVLITLLFVSGRWLLQRGCTGSRNVLDAFRKAVENEEERAHGIGELLLYI